MASLIITLDDLFGEFAFFLLPTTLSSAGLKILVPQRGNPSTRMQ